MDLGLKKINKISELKAGKTYIVSTKDISKAIRILPSKNMEGFFVSKFVKGEN